MEISEIFNVAVYIVAFITFFWTIMQQYWIRKKVNADEITTDADVSEIETLVSVLNADIKRVKAENTALRTDVWEYIDSTLRKLNQRLATRASRGDTEIQQKKGGIIGLN